MGGCSVTPEPEETAPAFATEEEAFAAAEQTYRAYVDALNQVDLSDPETFEPVFALTTGEANANERERLSQMHADGWTLIGDSSLDDFLHPAETSTGSATNLAAVACMNVSAVDVIDATGSSQVSPDRRDRYALLVNFDTGSVDLRVTSSNAIEDERCEA